MDNQAILTQLQTLLGADNAVDVGAQCVSSLLPDAWRHPPLGLARPVDTPQVEQIVRIAEQSGAAIVPVGSGSRLSVGYPPEADRPYLLVQTTRFNRVTDYQPEDLTVTVEPGATLAEIQRTLAERRQFLPLDCALPERATAAGIVSSNESGFSRPFYGTPRDLLIGMKAVMSGGVSVKGGGRVVKNVAGYDICKLFTGAWGTVGILTELTFRVRPCNETEIIVVCRAPNLAVATQVGLKVYQSPIAPAYTLATNELTASQFSNGAVFAVGLHGAALRVAWQREQIAIAAREAGIAGEMVTLTEQEAFLLRDAQARLAPQFGFSLKLACPPAALSGVIAALERLPEIRITAQPAVGTINLAGDSLDTAKFETIRRAISAETNVRWIRIDPNFSARHDVAIWGETRPDIALQRALKQALDPARTFSPGRFSGRI